MLLVLQVMCTLLKVMVLSLLGRKLWGLADRAYLPPPPIGCIDLLARQLWPCHQLALVPVQWLLIAMGGVTGLMMHSLETPRTWPHHHLHQALTQTWFVTPKWTTQKARHTKVLQAQFPRRVLPKVRNLTSITTRHLAAHMSSKKGWSINQF